MPSIPTPTFIRIVFEHMVCIIDESKPMIDLAGEYKKPNF